jgi:hypothetical protein
VEIRPLRHAGAIAILTAATSCGRIGYDGLEGADIRDGAGQVPTPDVSIDDSGNAADGYDSTRGNADQGSNDAAGDASTYFDANDAPGCAGLAASLDGTEYANVARIMQDDFTIEAWIRTTSIFSGTGAWDGAPIFWADVPGVMANDFSMSILDGLVAITVGNPDTTVRSVTFVATGQWMHIAATRSKSTGLVQVFVNGFAEASAKGNTNSLNGVATMQFGGNPLVHFFTGQMDEVRVWNLARSAAEIASTMHHTLTGSEPGLILYWRFEEGSGRVLRDSSTAHNDGALNLSIAWVPSTAPVCP